ncbi:MAG TPA: 3'(2'),5'-bisphosphate nucleotidase CysQ [Candidatus Acidoferrales bacterium]|nr:3'(2'),5'-bisphosphate nucleotidase CysQ [Candidatus Acidoferrales bacterium]
MRSVDQQEVKNISSDSGLEARIEEALQAALVALAPHIPGQVNVEYKQGDDPVTEADRAVNVALQEKLLREGEGWFSEETVDDFERLGKGRVWIVDPLDGTREFVAGIPEWCISVAAVEEGEVVAGGICNPATREIFLGSARLGLIYNGQPGRASQRKALQGASILASRSEIKRGEWRKFEGQPFEIRPTGSVAYKLALVAAGLADATWTLCPKHEWDIAAGVALVLAGGGIVRTLDNSPLSFNNREALLPGLIACGPNLDQPLQTLLAEFISGSISEPTPGPHDKRGCTDGL